MKPCSSCRAVKELEQFSRRARSKDGRSSSCRECVRARDAAYYSANAERKKALVRSYQRTERGKEVIKAARSRDWQRRPERKAARAAVDRALKNGALVKPEACWCCGNTGKIEAHHADYDRPLDVIWLCVMCHKAVHRITEEALCLVQSLKLLPAPSSSSTSSSSAVSSPA